MTVKVIPETQGSVVIYFWRDTDPDRLPVLGWAVEFDKDDLEDYWYPTPITSRGVKGTIYCIEHSVDGKAYIWLFAEDAVFHSLEKAMSHGVALASEQRQRPLEPLRNLRDLTRQIERSR